MVLVDERLDIAQLNQYGAIRNIGAAEGGSLARRKGVGSILLVTDGNGLSPGVENIGPVVNRMNIRLNTFLIVPPRFG